MKKNEFIVELTKLLVNSHDDDYTDAIVAALRLSHQLDEYPVPTSTEKSKIDRAMEQYLTEYKNLDGETLAQLEFLILNKQMLGAVKLYKDFVPGLGLKECKDEIDLVRKFGI
jgi:ribosomal protein L7/L12